MFLTLMFFTFYGMMAVAITPNVQLAAVLSSSMYSLWNLFCGFLIPQPKSKPYLSLTLYAREIPLGEPTDAKRESWSKLHLRHSCAALLLYQRRAGALYGACLKGPAIDRYLSSILWGAHIRRQLSASILSGLEEVTVFPCKVGLNASSNLQRSLSWPSCCPSSCSNSLLFNSLAVPGWWVWFYYLDPGKC